MRIGIDARLAAYRRGGIAEHVRRLAAGLAALAAPEDIVLLTHRKARDDGWPDGLTRRTVATPPHHRLEGITLPMEAALAGVGLLHMPDMVLPRVWVRPSVITVHDLAFVEHPEHLTARSRAYYNGVFDSVRRATRIITVSKRTRDAVLTHTRADPSRIRVVPNAVPECFFAPGVAADDAAVLSRLGVSPGAYLLFVGTIEPRKNLITLLEAYESAAEGLQGMPLVLAGAPGWHDAPIRSRVAAVEPPADARLLGPVADRDLPALYRGAVALVHPAWDEGFGLTVAEAMAAGTPVIAARAGSLPEVVGDAGLLVPPDEPAQWSAAMRRLAGAPSLSAELAAKGRARARRYDLRSMATATLDVYREAA